MLKSIIRKLPFVRQILDRNRNLKLILNEFVAAKRVQQELSVELIKANSRYDDPLCLLRHDAQFFSQNGEDGIIAEIFNRIGTTDQTFVEIGLGNGLESNTAFLLQQGWRGCWIEASEEGCRDAKEIFNGPIADEMLTIIQDFVKAETVEALFEKHHVSREFDLLSLDVDRNTYNIWKALPKFRPRVAIIEYNALIPPSVAYKVPYDPNSQWDGHGQFGASLKSYELLGKGLGYCLVGCDLVGVNAFFVREDLVADHFLEPFTAEKHFEPLRLHLLRNPHYPRNFEWAASPRD